MHRREKTRNNVSLSIQLRKIIRQNDPKSSKTLKFFGRYYYLGSASKKILVVLAFNQRTVVHIFAFGSNNSKGHTA